MADYERTILEFYQLPTPYPSEWPAEKDAGDSSGDDGNASKHRRRRSRYQALESAMNERRSLRSGTEGGQGGVGSVVQTDEPDPLGTSDSVVRSLKGIGVPVQDDLRLRETLLCSWPLCKSNKETF